MRGQRALGLQTVPLDKIVGSEGRFGEFDRSFYPQHQGIGDRWKRIGRARYRNENLPPVQLVKIGDIYFVRDGNHRLSVARSLGQEEIDAHVVEIETNVPLTADLDEAELEHKAAQSRFVERSGLLRVRPGVLVPLEASDPSTYDELMRHIEGHRYFLDKERGRDMSWDEAVASWYDNVYLPQVEAMRRLHVRAAFPSRTETNLFLSIMNHRHFLTEQHGSDPGPDTPVLDYMERFGPWRPDRQLFKRVRAWGRAMLSWLRPGMGADSAAPAG